MIRKKKEHKDADYEHASEVQKRRFEQGLAGFAGAVKRWVKKSEDFASTVELKAKDFPRHIKKKAKKATADKDKENT